MKQYVCLFLLFMVFCFSLDTLAYGNYQTSTEGVKNLDLALDETYYLELVSQNKGN